MTRRSLLKTGSGLALAGPLLAAGCSLAEPGNLTGVLLESRGKLPAPFRTRLPRPPVLRPVRRGGGVDHYEIVQRPAMQQILPDRPTPIWGYNGIFPGPTIESRSGRTTVVRHRNALPVPTVVHLHGGRTPPDSDGYPTDYVLPDGGWQWLDPDMTGETSSGERVYRYPLDQRAAMLWYHDHRMDFTGPSVWRGLAGFHIVRDAEEDALPLPRGEREVPLMLCDRAFEADGSFRYPARDPSLERTPGVTEDYMDGVMGDVVCVNGAPWPVLDVAPGWYRLRILNASNARRYELAMDPQPDDPPFVQIGSDGGLLGAPVRHETLPVAQAERFDVMVNFGVYGRGTEVTLRNRLGDGPTENVMRFRVTGDSGAQVPGPPERLADLSAYDGLGEADATVTRSFEFDRGGERDGVRVWTVNGKVFDPHRMDAQPAVGSTEVWELRSDPAHPIHLHQVHFKVLSRSRNDDRPLAKDAGWKDVIDLVEGERARILVPFDGYPGRYVFHCHNLEHEDMAMMANFRMR